MAGIFNQENGNWVYHKLARITVAKSKSMVSSLQISLNIIGVI